jgi:hypothetical protein
VRQVSKQVRGCVWGLNSASTGGGLAGQRAWTTRTESTLNQSCLQQVAIKMFTQHAGQVLRRNTQGRGGGSAHKPNKDSVLHDATWEQLTRTGSYDFKAHCTSTGPCRKRRPITSNIRILIQTVGVPSYLGQRALFLQASRCCCCCRGPRSHQLARRCTTELLPCQPLL